ncbi:far upstream element-binding protein 3 isoform X2 [Chrysoperla carnea]|uniref:far upstream element-binding protein 3 isoform X2 n=1 Tax=Chrysoperla carnea TaxID=189513 RepID=UPI001D090266|nr:far upstream element-binding protein 3 isoform X2 [Chrysoperla carnea]
MVKIAAKINPGAAATDPSRQKRPHDDSGSEPEPKKLAGLDFGPNQAMSPAKSGTQAQGAAAVHAAHIGLTSSAAPPPPFQGPVINEDIRVPDKMVGLIIGRGGEQITRLQAEAGCKIQMGADGSGQPDRVCSLSGPRDAIQRAKDMIYSIVQTHQRPLDSPPPPQHPPTNSNSSSLNSEFPGLGAQGGGGSGVTQVEIMVPGPKVGLIIGKGGETIKQLQEKSGAKMVVIQEGPNPEQEKPLRITGDPQKVEYAKQLVYDLIAEKEMQAYRGPGGGGGGGGPRGGNGGPPNQGNQNNRGDNRGPGGGGGGYGGSNDGDFGGNNGGNGGDGVEVQVPRAAVGVVIGKGGDMIKKIQAETGARVQFQQGRDDGPGDRRCFLTGKPQNVEAARQRIEELIDSVHRRDNEGGNQQGGNQGRNNNRGGGGGGGRNDFNNGNGNQRNGNFGGGAPQWGGGPQGNQSQVEVTFQVPTYKCGVIIGRGGETIKQINQQSGAHCELDRRAPPGNGQEKTFIIRGDAECVENAKRIISEKIQMPLYFTPTSNNGGGGGNPPPGMAPGPMNPAAIPTAYPGMAPQQAYNPQQQWGVAPGPDAAAGGYPQQWPQQNAAAATTQVQINPQTGQPDYSKQWAEYYRSLGMHREADMIEQQAKAGGAAAAVQAQPAATTVAPVAGQQPAAGQPTANGAVAAGGAVPGAAQPDYSAQWAEYYRSIGKIKEAEAIEAQMKSKTGAVAPGGMATSTAAVSVAGSVVTSTPSAPVQATAVTAAPGQPFAGYANYGGYYAQAQQQPLAGAGGAPAGGAAPQPQYGFPGYNQGYGQPQQTDNSN